jgi:hypothetical protein
MGDNKEYKLEGYKGDIYSFSPYPYPLEKVNRLISCVFIIASSNTNNQSFNLIYIGKSVNLSKDFKKVKVKKFCEKNKASHILIFEVDGNEEMEMIKQELMDSHPMMSDRLLLK